MRLLLVVVEVLDVGLEVFRLQDILEVDGCCLVGDHESGRFGGPDIVEPISRVFLEELSEVSIRREYVFLHVVAPESKDCVEEALVPVERVNIDAELFLLLVAHLSPCDITLTLLIVPSLINEVMEHGLHAEHLL